MRMIRETATYTTTTNPADALMASFDLFKGDPDHPWSATTRADNYFPYVVLVVDNVDLGVNLVVEISADTLDGDKAVFDDWWAYQIKDLAAADPVLTYTVPTATMRMFNIESNQSATAEEHQCSMAPRINVYGTATVASGKTVNITCYMAG